MVFFWDFFFSKSDFFAFSKGEVEFCVCFATPQKTASAKTGKNTKKHKNAPFWSKANSWGEKRNLEFRLKKTCFFSTSSCFWDQRRIHGAKFLNFREMFFVLHRFHRPFLGELQKSCDFVVFKASPTCSYFSPKQHRKHSKTPVFRSFLTWDQQPKHTKKTCFFRKTPVFRALVGFSQWNFWRLFLRCFSRFLNCGFERLWRPQKHAKQKVFKKKSAK